MNKELNHVELNITPVEINLSVEESAVYYNNISMGYVHIGSASLAHKEMAGMIESLKETITGITEYNFSKHINIVIQLYSDDVIVYFQGNTSHVGAMIFAKSPGTLKEVWDILQSEEPNDDVYIDVDTLSLIGGQLNRGNRLISRKDIDYVSEKYYPYICVDSLFKEFFASHESILLLTGEPGLGKSKLATLAMQYAINHPNEIPYPIDSDKYYINLVFIRGTEVLSSEEFWMDLESFTPDFVIIDDLDNMLTTREADIQSQEDVLKNKFMNQFLSFTDGIEKRKTKFIITTNQNYRDIDSAVLREGRLFDIIEMRSLTKEEALDIWVSEGINEEYFDKLQLGNKVSAAKLGSYIYKHLHKSGDKSYLKEDGISKSNDVKNRRKIKI